MPKAHIRILSYFAISLILILILSSKITSATIVNPVYIEAQLLGYTQADQGTSISVIVAVVNQPGGQASILGGTTNTNNNYGVSLDKNWMADSGAPSGQYVMGWTNGASHGWISFSGGTVHNGDRIVLTLSIVNGNVQATATDMDNSHITASHSSSATGATQFIGTTNDDGGDGEGFTGLISTQTFASGWYYPNTQIETFTLPPGESPQPAVLGMTEASCDDPPTCTTGTSIFEEATTQPIDPDPNYIINDNGIVSQYWNDGTYETGLYSSLAISLDSPKLQSGQEATVTATQVADAVQYKELILNGPGFDNQLLDIFEPALSVSFTFCTPHNECPRTAGEYTVNVITIDISDGANQSASTKFTVEPQGVSEAICPNNDQNNGGPINTFNGTAPTTGTMPPQCGVQCPNNAFNPLPEGFAGVGTQYCNIFCPNGQDNYAGGPGNDAPCTQCPNGVITTGQCSQYCFNGWGLIISPDSACAGFGTPLNYTYIGNCGLVIPSNPNAYNNNGIHHDLAGSNLGSGSGGINTGFGDVPFGGSSGIGQLCYNLLINNTNSSILIGKNTISNNTTQSSGPFGGFLNHLLGTASATTTIIETKKS
jgi:hypothetical protein